MARDQIREDFDMNFEFDPKDFEGFDLGSFDDPTPVTNDRNPVLQIAGSAVKGASKALKDTELQRSIIEKSLPEGYVRTYDAAIGAKSTLEDLHYEATQSLRELIKTTKRTIAPLSEKISVALPKDMATKINSWAATGNDDDYHYNPNDYKRMEMQSAMGQIFGGWEQIRDQINADKSKSAASPDMATEIYNSSIHQELLANIYEETSKIRLNSDMDREYRENIQLKLQEKQVELGYKTLWAMTSVADIAQQNFDFTKAQIPKIIKNTGLPELVKEHNNEIAIKLLKQRSLGGAVEMFGSSFSDIGGRIVRKTKDQINTFFKEAVGTTMRASSLIQSMGGDQYDDVVNPNETEEERTERRRRQGVRDGLSGAAETGSAFLTNRYARKLGEKLRTLSDSNPKIARVGMALTNLFDAMPHHLNDALGYEKDSGSKIWDAFRQTFGLEELKWKDKTLVRGQSIDDLSTRAVYTVHEKRAITEIIPGWLAKIHNEIRMHRTGLNDLDPMTWSFESNKFEDSGETATRIKKKFLNEDRFKSSANDLEAVIKAIDPNGTLNDTGKDELRKVLTKAAYDPSQRISLETLAKDEKLSDDTRRALTDMARELQGLNINLDMDPSVLGEARRDFKGTKEEQERRAQIYASMRNLRNGLPSNFNDALRYVSAGEMEHLAKQGIVKQNEKGEWHYNRDKMSDELSKHVGELNGRTFGTGGFTGSGSDIQPSDRTHKNEFVIKADIVRQPGVKEFLTSFNANGMAAVKDFNGKEVQPIFKTQKNFAGSEVTGILANLVDAVQEGNVRDVLIRQSETLKNVQAATLEMAIHGVTTVQQEDAKTKAGSLAQAGSAASLKDILGKGSFFRRVIPANFNNVIENVEGAIDTGKKLKSFLPRIKSMLGKKGGSITAATADMEHALGAGDAANVMVGAEQVSILKQVLDRIPTRKKVAADGDGDGLRDGSWQEQLRDKAKAKAAGKEPVKKEDEEKEKPKSIFGLLGTLVTMVGGLATTVASWFSKIFKGGKTIINLIKSFLQMKAVGGALDGLGDMANGRKNRGRRGPFGMFGRRGARGAAGALEGAATTSSKFGLKGKLLAGGLLGAAGLAAMAGGEDNSTLVDKASDLSVDFEQPEESSGWMEKLGTASDVAMAGGAALWGAKKIGGLVGGRAGTAVATQATQQVAAGAGRGLLARAGGMIAGQGIRTGLVALGSVISAPVALGIAAGALAAYGGYKLYKYMKSKKAYVNNWRMAQYGYSYRSKDAVEKITQLEAKCLEYVTVSSDLPAQFRKGLKPEDLIGIFNIDLQDKKAVNRWVSWFAYRFKPVFLGAVTVYNKMTGNTNIHEADDKLTDSQKKSFIEATNVKDVGMSNPYSIIASPLPDEETVNLDMNGVTSVYRDMMDTLKKSTLEGEKEGKDEAQAKKDTAKANSGEKSWWEQSKEKAKGWMSNLSDGLKDTLGKIKGKAATFWGKTADAAGNLWEGAKNTVSNAWDTTKQAASDFGTAVTDGATKIYEKLSGTAKQNQLSVYKAFRHAGLNDNQSRIITAEVGRENDYLSKYLFGGHSDPHNGKYNLGFISWQGDRGKNLFNYLKARGLIDSSNKIVQSQEALDAQAQFLLDEIKQKKEYGPTKQQFLSNPAVDYNTGAYVLGKNFIRWRIDDPKYASHKKRRDNHYANLVEQLQSNPGAAKEGPKAAGKAFVPYKPEVLKQKSAQSAAANPLGNNGKVLAAAQGGFANAVSNAPKAGGQIYTRPSVVHSPADGEIGQPGVVGPVGAGIVTGNVPKGHRAVKAAESATRKANPTSTGFCAKYVANALQSAGYKFTRQNSAHQYANGPLASAGFTKIPNNGRYQIGDVMVWPAHGQGFKGGAIHGHIQIYNGRNWVSDFIQGNMRPGPKYAGVSPTLWRDSTILKANIQGSVEAKGANPTDKPAAETKADGATPKAQTASKTTAIPAARPKAAIAAAPANNGGTSYSGMDVGSSKDYSDGASGESTSSTVSNNLANANIERIANEQLKALNNMDANLVKIVQSLGRMEKNSTGLAQQATQQQATANQNTPPANQQPNGQGTADTSSVRKGLDALFGPRPQPEKPAPVDLRS